MNVPNKPDLEWLRKVAALCPNMDGTEDMLGIVRGVHGAMLATAPAEPLGMTPRTDALYSQWEEFGEDEEVDDSIDVVDALTLARHLERELAAAHTPLDIATNAQEDAERELVGLRAAVTKYLTEESKDESWWTAPMRRLNAALKK